MDLPNDNPFPETYWVIPGRFLAGAYPGDFDPVMTHKKMAAFIKIGIDTFIDLTRENELPDYESILLEEASNYDIKVTHLRFTITDKGLPSHKNMAAILDSIDQLIAAGHKIYLHCWGGIGRTGTTVGCFFVHQGSTGQEALQKLSLHYRTTLQSRLHPNSPETQEQVDFILNWHED